MKKYSLAFLIIFLITTAAKAQTQVYSVKAEIPQLSKNDRVVMGYYYADKTFPADTAKADAEGRFVFEGNEALPGGMYLLILPGQKTVEFLASEDQKFSLTISDTANILNSVKIKGSRDNERLYEYQRYMQKQSRKFEALQERRQNNAGNADSLKKINAAGKTFEVEIEKHWKYLAKKHSGTLFAKILAGMNISSEEARRFGNFFDKVDFSDERLLRSPIIFKTIRYVLARNLNANKSPRFIMGELEELIEKSRANPKVYEYTVSYLLNFFNSFQRIGMNRVFVFLAENYVLNGNSNWYNEKALVSIAERTSEMRAGFIGETAPDITTETFTGDSLKLHSLKKPYTLLFFWSTGCGHCEQSTRDIKNFLLSTDSRQFAVYAVYTKDSRRDWEKYISDFEIEDWHNVWDKDNNSNYKRLYYVVSTPLLYVLDDDKKIIGFRAGDGPILDLLNELEKQSAD